MSFDALSFGMLGTSVMEAGLSYGAGREAQATYNAQARELQMQTAYQQRTALEQMKDLNEEAQSAQSKAIAAAGGSGLRVAGSVATISQNISRTLARRKALIGLQFNEQARENQFQADLYRWQGKRAKRAGAIEAFGSLLTGGLKLAKRKEKMGFGSWRETFFGKPGMTNEAKATLLKY